MSMAMAALCSSSVHIGPKMLGLYLTLSMDKLRDRKMSVLVFEFNCCVPVVYSAVGLQIQRPICPLINSIGQFSTFIPVSGDLQPPSQRDGMAG